MHKLLGFLKGYRAVTVLGPLLKLLEAVGELVIPLVVARIIDVGIAGGNTAYVWKMGGVMLALGAAGLALAISAQYMAARASTGFGTNLRGALYSHIHSLSLSELDRFGTAGLLTRINSDTVQAQTGVAMFIRLVLRAPFLVAGALVMAISISPKISIIFLITAVIVSIILWLVMSRTAPYYRKIQANLDEVSLLTRETLSGARVVRAFSNQQTEQRDFFASADSLKKKSVKANALSALLNPLTYAVINLAVIAVLYFGGKTVEAGNLKQGDVIALVNYLSQILLALVVTANLAVTFTKASASAARINEVFATTPKIVDTATTSPARQDGSAKLEFENVSFSYYDGGRCALSDINFSINGGETLGVIGSTGSGKSTLINLVPRFFDVTEGQVLVDGADVRNIKKSTLRRLIGYVPQKGVLFSGTVKSNIAFGNENLSDEEIISAAKVAEADGFITEMEKGYDSEISQGGKNVSGGQKQRLSIARAVAVKPEIFIFDDSFSALDYKTDKKVRENLKEAAQGATKLIVAQRIGTIMDADKIIVLDSGKAVGIGTHKQLLKDCEVYREIALSQLSKEELGL